jgi:hypothetical protein
MQAGSHHTFLPTRMYLRARSLSAWRALIEANIPTRAAGQKQQRAAMTEAKQSLPGVQLNEKHANHT